jgi:hypothetical protein
MIESHSDKDVLRDPLTAMRRLGVVSPEKLSQALALALAAPVGDARGIAVIDLLEAAYRQPEGLATPLRVQALKQLQSQRPNLVQGLRERLRNQVVLLQLYADALGAWDESALGEVADGLLQCPPSAHRRPCVRALMVRLHRAGRHQELAALLPRVDLLEYLDLCGTESYWRGAFGKSVPGPGEVLKVLANRMNWLSSAEERRAALDFCRQLPQRLSEAEQAAIADTVRSVALRVDDPDLRSFLTAFGARLPNNRRW